MFESFIAEKNFKSPIGIISILATNNCLFRIFINDNFFEDEDEDEDDSYSSSIIREVWQFLDAYFKGEMPKNLKVPLIGSGTKFQNTVWDKVNEIPFGAFRTYQDIAQQLEQKDARSVGMAVKNNNFPIIVPCHRVIPKNGKFTGYQDEIERQLWLLNFEREILEKQNSKGKK